MIDPVFAGRGVPRGDGGPVMLIPGFLAGDTSLSVMAGWLDRMGHRPHRSGIACNVGCSDRALDALEARAERIAGDAGRPLALIGHSRGGHFAKALGHRRPDLVSRVITMGSGLDTAFDISIPTRAAVAAVRWVHVQTTDRVAKNGCFTDTCRCRFTQDFAGEFPSSVPLVSIYSRGDGVVWWEACTVPYARNVEVTGSHIGLAYNRKAYRVIGDALVRRRGAAAARRRVGGPGARGRVRRGAGAGGPCDGDPARAGPRAEVVRAFLELADAVLYGRRRWAARARAAGAATSEANVADYSAGVHATLLSELGDAGEHDEALRAFARRLTLAPAEAEDAVAALQAHLSDAEVYDAVAVVGLLNLANRSALATGITVEDDLP